MEPGGSAVAPARSFHQWVSDIQSSVFLDDDEKVHTQDHLILTLPHSDTAACDRNVT